MTTISFDALQQMVYKLRDNLSVELRDKILTKFVPAVAPVTLNIVSAWEAFAVMYENRDTGNCVAYTFSLSHDYSTEFSRSGLKILRSPFMLTQLPVLYPLPGETVEDFILRTVDKCMAFYQKAESRGSTKVFLDALKVDWIWKRLPNDKVVEYEGEYFFAPTDGRFTLAYRSETETAWSLPGDDVTYVSSVGQIWFNSSLIALYENTVPFSRVVKYILPSEAARYEFILMDGERRYVNVKREGLSITAVPIHTYSTRIETVVKADKLFLKGKTDLYEKRGTDETPFLGFELEAIAGAGTVNVHGCAKAMKEHLPYQVICKADGSIGSSGFETVSVPATLDYWKESDLVAALNSMRVKPYSVRAFEHSNCGFHVHVSRSALSVLDLQKMERFVHNPANLEFMQAVGGRGQNQYANYYPSLFNKRATTAERSRSTERAQTIDGIKYLRPYDEIIREAENFRRNWSGGLKNKIVSKFLSNYVSHARINRLFMDNLSLQGEFLPGFLYYIRYGDIISYINTAVNQSSGGNPVYFERFLGTELHNTLSNSAARYEAVLNQYKLMIAKLTHHSNAFAYVMHKLGIEWEGFNIVTENPVTSAVDTSSEDIPAWKKVLTRKTSAPFKRQLSYSACQSVKGPVGKAVMGRYDILNTNNQNTVEFRLFKGTMNPTSIMRYLEFVDALVRFVPNTSANDDGLHYNKFAEWLTSDGFNITRYEHLVSFLKGLGFVGKDIKRRNMPTVVSADSFVEGLVAIEPKGFEELSGAQPLGTFTANPNAVISEPVSAITAQVPSADEEEHTYDPDEYCEDCGGPCQMED